ncbi:MAG: cadherin-like beta sandwich domain-containing protein [Clostridia bacterium]|nr:cadherin-like beta sandwich domain-containing protein [Clostridia bacterium]
MSEEKNKDNTSKRKIVVKILIILIIILLLLTSCSVINHFGHIGDINKEDQIDIHDNINDLKINKNDKLKFDLIDYKEGLIIYLEDGDYKLSYTANGFKSKKYSCKTSNAKVATCEVKDGYVLIKPKQQGHFTLTISAKANGYKYIAQTKVEVKSGSSKPSYTSSKSKSNTKTNKTKKPSTTNKIVNSDKKPESIKKSSDARLKTLKVDNGKYKIAPTFNPDNTEYVVVVPTGTNQINLSGKTNSDKAQILSGLGNIQLKNNSTEVQIVVKAEDGTLKTYTVKINKKNNINILSTDATLKHLGLEGYVPNPLFQSNVFKYTVNVPYEVTSLNIDAIPNYSGSLVTISGNNNFKVGNNLVTIKVTAENGSTNTYLIAVNRLDSSKKETNANLSSLAVEGYTISPSFNKNTYNYTLNGIVPKDVQDLIVKATAEDSDSKVTITGHENLKEGTNTITVTVTSKDGVKKAYTITVNKELTENLDDFYIKSSRNYKVGYRKDSPDNYKNIIIESNILDGVITNANVTKSIAPNGETRLTISDGNSYIILEGPFDLDYVADEGSKSSYAIKVSYNSLMDGKIKVSGYRKGLTEANKVDSYEINFDIEPLYYVTLHAGNVDGKQGFFNSLADKYELSFFDNEELDLSPYNEAYVLTDETNCKSYKFIGYDADSSKTSNPNYKLELDANNNKVINPKITVHKDLDLYAIYDTKDATIDYKASGKLYLTDVDIFVLDDNTKHFIYPGTLGSYIMRIKNTTNDTITLNKLNIEEDTICSSENNCLNMGYIIKRYNNSSYSYYGPNGGTNEYWILNKEASTTKKANLDGSYHFTETLDLNSITLQKGEETEISLLWKWVDSDGDTEIGNYVVNNNDIYKLTISYEFEKKDKMCDK